MSASNLEIVESALEAAERSVSHARRLLETIRAQGATHAERVYSREEAAEYLGIGLSKLDARVRSGVLPSFKDGAKRCFTERDFAEYRRRLGDAEVSR